VIVLLRRSDGATIVDLTGATGWLPHTTRAALTGLRKRGYAVARERVGAGGSIYRISGAAAEGGNRIVVQPDATHGLLGTRSICFASELLYAKPDCRLLAVAPGLGPN